MRGILKSVAGDPISAAHRGRHGFPVGVLDGRVEIVVMLDDPTQAEIDALKSDVGRGYYAVRRDSALQTGSLGVIADVIAERSRQDQLWGTERDYTPLQWFAVLGEEYGEVGKKVTQGFVPPESDFDRVGYRKELIQTAAVAVAAVEELDRQDKQMRS